MARLVNRDGGSGFFGAGAERRCGLPSSSLVHDYGGLGSTASLFVLVHAAQGFCQHGKGLVIGEVIGERAELLVRLCCMRVHWGAPVAQYLARSRK